MLFERIKLEDDENVLKVVRKHWWVIFSRALFTIFLMLMPLVFVLFMTTLDFGLLDNTISNIFNTAYLSELLLLYSAWILLNWMVLANFWTDHYLDLWAITNKRVVKVDQRGFFRRFLSSFRLERLQDMNIEVDGVLATILDYGTIEAQTAGGSNEEFVSPHMPKPRDIKALIVGAADDLNNNHNTNVTDQGL